MKNFLSKKTITIVLLLFSVVLAIAAIYIGLKLGNIPTTTPEEAEAYKTDPDTGIVYQFYGGGGVCSLATIDNTLCLVYNQPNIRYNQFAKHWCYGNWSSNLGGCSCPYNGYGTGAGQCAPSHTPKPGKSLPGEDPACLDGSFGIQGCNPEIYFEHTTYRPNNYANTVCLDREWCEFQQIDLLIGTGNFTCYLSGYMGDICLAVTNTPTITPSITYTITPTLPGTITPTLSVTPTNTITPTSPGTVTPTTPGTVTPTLTNTITPSISNTNTPTISISVTPTITTLSPTLSPPVTTPPTTTLPPTALISDEVDRVLIGLILIIFGAFIYQSGTYIKIGNLFWNNGGDSIFKGTKTFTDKVNAVGRKTKNGINNVLNYMDSSIINTQSNIKNTARVLSSQAKHTSQNIGKMFSSFSTKLSDRKLGERGRFEKQIIRDREKKDN